MLDLSNHLKTIKTFEETIENIYREYNLKCVADFDDVIFDGENPLMFEYKHTYPKQLNMVYGFKNLFWLKQDIYNCARDIKYFTGLILLYKPFINNDLPDEFYFLDGKKNYAYHKCLCDSRCFMYLSIVIEKIYNYWDRLGDFLEVYFQLGLDKREIYFEKVIKSIPVTYHSSSNYNRLKYFLDNVYNNKLNKYRKEIVHYQQLDSKSFQNFLDSHNDEIKLNKLQNEREEYAKFVTEQLQMSITGFEKVVRLIGEK